MVSKLTLSAPAVLRGTVTVPGDKSISHRAAILNAIAQGRSRVENFSPGADCLSTVNCLRAMGVALELTPGERPALEVSGVGKGGLREAADVLDAGNSGTTLRLLSGLLSAQPLFSVLTGDDSLRSRPMGRIIQPLRLMGAQIWGRGGDSLPPVAIRGGPLHGMEYRTPVASAQVKSALLLAGLFASGETVLHEPLLSRDHTERMVRAMGARLERQGLSVSLQPLTMPLTPLNMVIPGDISAAAFFLVAGAIHEQAEIHIKGVGVNPTRTGILDVLQEMGATITITEEREQGGEPVADIIVRSSQLRGVTVGGEVIPRLIDEIPVLAVAAAVASGTTVIRDAAELRVKESDRIAATARELSLMGAHIEELPDGMIIHGVGKLHGAAVESHGDHRLAMALAVAALNASGETVIQGDEAVAISYPAFWRELEGLSRP